MVVSVMDISIDMLSRFGMFGGWVRFGMCGGLGVTNDWIGISGRFQLLV